MTRHTKNLKRQLATESIFALVRLRQTGQPPTQEDSLLLMDVWKQTLDFIVAGGPITQPKIRGYGNALRFYVTAFWDDKKRLTKFVLHDIITGSLLLAGDMNGPVFPTRKSSTIQTAIQNQKEINS